MCVKNLDTTYERLTQVICCLSIFSHTLVQVKNKVLVEIYLYTDILKPNESKNKLEHQP